ncbi:MAG: NRDE family protein [Gammaproteobacteria bacterium]|nr:NRDE family protein [Gammaproteobacteria bacterium]
MCLIAFAIGERRDYPLILLANRDEFFQRPTAPLQQWSQAPELFGGRDQFAGGTWLALDRSGRFAAVTNFRQHPSAKATRSRGELVVNALTTDLPLVDFFQQLSQHDQDYQGYNLVVGDILQQQVFYHNNSNGQTQKLPPGIYALSNGPLATPWPKMNFWRERLEHYVKAPQIDEQALLHLAQQQPPIAPEHLPDTGIGSKLEQTLAAPFIQPFTLNGQVYGTRSTALLISQVSDNLVTTAFQEWQWPSVPNQAQTEPSRLPLEPTISPVAYQRIDVTHY